MRSKIQTLTTLIYLTTAMINLKIKASNDIIQTLILAFTLSRRFLIPASNWALIRGESVCPELSMVDAIISNLCFINSREGGVSLGTSIDTTGWVGITLGIDIDPIGWVGVTLGIDIDPIGWVGVTLGIVVDPIGWVGVTLGIVVDPVG